MYMMELSSGNSYQLKVVNYLHENAPSQWFNRLLNPKDACEPYLKNDLTKNAANTDISQLTFTCSN